MKINQKANICAKLVLCELFIFMFFTGCSSSPGLIERYPDFLKRKDHISSILLGADVVVVFHGFESGEIIDIPLSLTIGDSILSIFKQALQKKNYPIGEVFPPAVGNALSGNEMYYRVFRDESDYSRNTDSLEMMPAPFVVNDKFLELQKIWNNKNRPAAASASDISKNYDEEQRKYLLFAYLEAHNVSLSKRIGDGLLTTVLSLGTVSSNPVATASLFYWLYDLKTNDVVLSDGRTMTGPNLTGNNIADLMEKMLERIPLK
jgi:hypothetical protein